jgi:hypothetical protein
MLRLAHRRARPERDTDGHEDPSKAGEKLRPHLRDNAPAPRFL